MDYYKITFDAKVRTVAALSDLCSADGVSRDYIQGAIWGIDQAAQDLRRALEEYEWIQDACAADQEAAPDLPQAPVKEEAPAPKKAQAKKKPAGRKPKVDTAELWKLWQEGYTTKRLAEHFDVSTGTINTYLTKLTMEGGAK